MKPAGDLGKAPLASIMGFIFILVLARRAHSSPVTTNESAISCVPITNETAISCNKGCGYDPASNTCNECDQGFYMEEEHHRSPCKRCPLIGGIHEYLKSGQPCPRDSRPHIVCWRSDQFYTFPKNDELEGECHNCKICDNDLFLKRTCGEYSDTVCCPYSSEDPMCTKWTFPPSKETTVPITTPSPQTSTLVTTILPPLCGKDQFYEASTSSCQTCPQHTFLNQTDHREVKCVNSTSDQHPVSNPCDTDKGDHTIVIFLSIFFALFAVFLIMGVIYCYRKQKSNSYQLASGPPQNENIEMAVRQNHPDGIEPAIGHMQPEEACSMLAPLADKDNL